MAGRRPRPIPPVPPISPAADPDPGTRAGSGSGSDSAPGTGFGPDSGSGSGSGSEAPARRTALEAVLQKVRLRWGHGSIVRLDGEGEGEGEGESRGSPAPAPPPPPRRPKELPPWWPGAGGPWTRPRILELTGEAGEGRLALALAWLAAARPALVAVVDPAHPSGLVLPPGGRGRRDRPGASPHRPSPWLEGRRGNGSGRGGTLRGPGRTRRPELDRPGRPE